MELYRLKEHCPNCSAAQVTMNLDETGPSYNISCSACGIAWIGRSLHETWSRFRGSLPATVPSPSTTRTPTSDPPAVKQDTSDRRKK